MLLIEHCTPDEVITAPEDVSKVREASMHLKPGEKVTARNMLYALMLRSANDGCYAVAVHIAGSVEAFAKMMNERAKELGCTHTHFHNPNGLNDVLHYTTAHDLALMGRAAMRYPQFREAVRTYKIQIDRSIDLKDRVMVNHDKYLLKDPSADGIKTGYTVPAGHCFVGSSNRNGFRVITVVMKSDHWQLDHQNLLHWAYGRFEVKEHAPEGEIVASASVYGGAQATVLGALGEPLDVVGPRGAALNVSKTFEPLSNLSAPIKKGQKVGDYIVRDGDGFSQTVPVLATADVSMSPVAAIKKKGSQGSYEVMGAALCVGAFLMRGKSRRIVKQYGRPKPRSL
jgi:D-alanyl-D-alanine carboxypeptidase (penicillin-binding protein 5/6)